jgi:hypothetical protein
MITVPQSKNHPTGDFFVSAKGLEPLTNGLKGHCSTIELRAQDGLYFIMHLLGRQPNAAQ